MASYLSKLKHKDGLMKAESIQTQTLIGFRKGSFYVNEAELNELMTDTLDLMLGTTKLQHRKE